MKPQKSRNPPESPSLDSNTSHAPTQPMSFEPGAAGRSEAVRGWPVHLLVALTVAGAALLGGAAAGALALAFGWLPALAAAFGAALGVALASLPLVAVALRAAQPRAVPAAPVGAQAIADAGLTRPQFLELADREWARARRYGSGAAVLPVDLDRSTRLAETHGRDAGDIALAELAAQIQPTLRGADALARFGAAQLAVFLAHADTTGALDVAERIRERAEALELKAAGLPKLRITVSVGSASLRPAHLNLQALIMDAEDAVLAARQAGGNCVRAAPVDAVRHAAGPGQPGAGRGERRARRPGR
jgi:diguanylate cyclase